MVVSLKNSDIMASMPAGQKTLTCQLAVGPGHWVIPASHSPEPRVHPELTLSSNWCYGAFAGLQSKCNQAQWSWFLTADEVKHKDFLADWNLQL